MAREEGAENRMAREEGADVLLCGLCGEREAMRSAAGWPDVPLADCPLSSTSYSERIDSLTSSCARRSLARCASKSQRSCYCDVWEPGAMKSRSPW